MNVTLLAHTQLSEAFYDSFDVYEGHSGFAGNRLERLNVNDRQAVALTAIRTCYSANKPSEIVSLEGEKYFGQVATDGKSGSEADRLFRHITGSGHTSTLEHISYTFAIEGVSRSLLAQLTRHRQISFSVQSQRYVRFGSADKSGGMQVVYPPKVMEQEAGKTLWEQSDDGVRTTAFGIYHEHMEASQQAYDRLRAIGVPAEDARFVLPNAASCNLVMTLNLRALLEFYGKRKKGKGAQWEIAQLADQLRSVVVAVDPWLDPYFGGGDAE